MAHVKKHVNYVKCVTIIFKINVLLHVLLIGHNVMQIS